MRVLLRAGLVLLGVSGLVIAFAWTARAEVVDPRSPFQPASTNLVSGQDAQAEELSLPAMPVHGAIPSAEDEAGGEAAAGELEAAAVEPEAVVTPAVTPAPEQQIVSRTMTAPSAQVQEGSVLDRTIQGTWASFRDVGTFLGRAASACQVGLMAGAGGPVLVLAVLSMAVPFIRRRVAFARWAADEDVPELLYAREVIAPG